MCASKTDRTNPGFAARKAGVFKKDVSFLPKEEWIRTEMLLGAGTAALLARRHVAVFGIGGVGGYVVEALARSGVGELTLVDHDRVNLSNINRQIIATHETVGQNKVDAARARVLQINPDCIVHTMALKYEETNRDLFFACRYDYIADCIDLVKSKLDLICTARERGIPILSAMGTGNKLDPFQLRLADLSETEGCGLARVMRKELRRRGVLHTDVVYSPELPVKPAPLVENDPGRRSTPASCAWVPSCAGLMMGGRIVQELLRTAGEGGSA